nr:phosphatidylinositide phosphatase sac1 [Hymenolepis microstoma]
MDSPRAYDLFIVPDQYIISNASSTTKERPIVIDRVTGAVSLSNHSMSHYETLMPRANKIFGILGTIRLLSGRFLVTIDQCVLAGNLFGHQIFKVEKASIHPFAKSNNHLNAIEMEAETAYLNMLTFMLNMEGMYFSSTYDLTVSQQRLSEFGPEYRHMNLYERAEKQFLWNHYLLEDWSRILNDVAKTCKISFSIHNYLTPVILGFVEIAKASNSLATTGAVASYALISRRSIKRAGTRFYARGVDDNGNSANFVETEQIVYIPPGHIFSFVQIRGSVPLYWSQTPSLKYKPAVRLGTPRAIDNGTNPEYEPQGLIDVQPEQRTIIQKHFNDVCYSNRYGKVVAVNLLDQTGMEKPLCRMYTLASQAVNPFELSYQAFDFHKECRALRWDRLQILIDRLEPELTAMSQLRLRAPTNRESLQDACVLSQQNGVFRVNCIDCLDRTNVLQSMLARQALVAALREVSGDCSSDSELWPGFGTVFKNLWADHADVISIQYSGTPALKTDFTRTGKRTIKGALMDAYNSAVRYYLNNFVDGFRQDAFNLFLGHYRVFSEIDGRAKLPLPIVKPKSDAQAIRKSFLPIFFAFSTAMSALCLFFPSVDVFDRFLYFGLWGLASFFSAATIMTYGEEFVNKPMFPIE